MISWLRSNKDKLLHFGVNFVVGLTAVISWQFAIGACGGLSIGKEYGDSKAKGNKWSWMDIVADAIGATFGIGIGILIRRAING